jgi:DNA-binding FrmR family transcriptional regulator
MNSETHARVQKRVNRVAGQVGGIQKMVAEGRYCVDILNQIAAARSALDALGVELLNSHVESCILGHGTGSEHAHAKPMKPQQLLAELQTALSRFLR